MAEKTGKENLQDENLQPPTVDSGYVSPESLDPGALEGKTKPTKDEPPEGSKRWNQIYARMKEAERQIEERDTQAKTIQDELNNQKEAFEGLREHNRQLSESMQTKAPPESTTDIDKQLTQLEDEMAQAFDEGDLKKGSRLQVKINRLQLQSIKVPNADEIITKVNQTMGQQAQQQQNNTIFMAWLKNNPWYQKDAMMRGAADAMGVELQKSGKTYDQVLDEVSEKINQKFNVKKEPANFASVESGSTVTPAEGGTGLSAEERVTAKRFGMTDKEYLSQKVAIEGGAR